MKSHAGMLMAIVGLSGLGIAAADFEPSPAPATAPVRKPRPARVRDPNHPAVIAAQARQRRKAAKQAKGFVS